jgi:ribosome maturation factor RimP
MTQFQTREEEAKTWVQNELREFLKDHPLYDDESEPYLVDCTLRSYNSSDTLEIYLDTETGVTISQCERFSRHLSAVFDASPVIQELFRNYLRIEVSSPGADRPIKDIRSLKRHIGRRVSLKFKTGSAEAAQSEKPGSLLQAEGKLLAIETDEANQIALVLDTTR